METLVEQIAIRHAERRPSSPDTEEEELDGYLETVVGRVERAQTKERLRAARVLTTLRDEQVDLVLLKVQTDDDFEQFYGVHVDHKAHRLEITMTQGNQRLVDKIIEGLRFHPNFLHFRVIVGEGDLSIRRPPPDKIIAPTGAQPDRLIGPHGSEDEPDDLHAGQRVMNLVHRGVKPVPEAMRRGFLEISDQAQDDMVNFVMEKVYMDEDHDDFCSVYRDGQLRCLVVTLSAKNLQLVEKMLPELSYSKELWYFRVVVCEARGAARQLNPIHATPWQSRRGSPPSPFAEALTAFLKQYRHNRRVSRDFGPPIDPNYRIAVHLNDLPTIYRDVLVTWGSDGPVVPSKMGSEGDESTPPGSAQGAQVASTAGPEQRAEAGSDPASPSDV